ncbi:DNA polymerase alpha subunit B isoform X1 [Ceratitis capitata]|uniref:DNA polymerase alpha subunit B isoform X1 n=1 Tax=Ceratitis capitata TaxID=7213 RepID=UPI000329BBA9|nr:DNA polymerase alpha subunit B isoform X1 [Ceratitis capitata]
MDVEIKQQFEEMGVEVSEDVITKSLELCVSYRVDDAAEFVEQWLAFSISNLHGAEPTTENLLEFERKVFQVKRDKELAQSNRKRVSYATSSANTIYAPPVEANPLAIYGVDDSAVIEDYDVAGVDGSSIGQEGVNEDEMLGSYNVCHTPKPKARNALARTPARHSDALLFSPASYSPISGTPRSHTALAGSGKIVYTFGNPTLIGTAKWASAKQKKIDVKQLLRHKGATLDEPKSNYMYDCLRERCDIAADRIFHIGKDLCKKVFGANADDYELSQVDEHSQELTKTIGTICCDHEGPLDPSSTMLAGSDEARCLTVRLNFSKAKSAAVFPGQIAIVSGKNPKGDTFIVDEVFTERQLSPPTTPSLTDPLSFVIAAGPYTNDDDLAYEPLQDLIVYLKDHKPDVLVLTGPFLDAEHKLISENLTLAESFESFFEKMITSIVEAIGTMTKILIVTSHKDANADPVYPTMSVPLRKSYPNVHVLPDPSMIDLNGIVMGMTTTDIVQHIISHELAFNAGDKVKRVVNHLFHQGSFYPLQPPACDEMSFDSFLAARYAKIEQIPNILILPSDQKCFIRVVNGCLAINPGRLADNNGGTFARFVISPPANESEENIHNFVACQIRKV